MIERCATSTGAAVGCARDDAVDEVAEVVVALVEVDLVGADLGVEQRLRGRPRACRG